MDEKDKKILEILQENSRTSLKSIGKSIGLSIDATKKRIEKLRKQGIISKFSVFIDPKAAGYDIVVENKIKLHNLTQEARKKFIMYLYALPQCIELISISGEYDFTCVIIAKNTKHLNDTIYTIRERFKEIIADWKTSFNLEVYKFEKYSFAYEKEQ